jgi:hypothetical protein
MTRGIIADYGGVGKGELVLERSLPPHIAEIWDHKGLGPNRMVAARAAMPIALIASPNGDPVGAISDNVASRASAQLVKCSKRISSFSLKHLTQPRTVVSGRQIF